MKILKGRELKYIRWQNENYSDLDSVDISWLRICGNIMIFIILSYLVVAIWENVWSVIVHTMTVIVCFSILVYKGVFYENSYPRYLAECSGDLQEIELGEGNEISLVENPSNENSFESKLPEYVERLETWMKEEKPYLYKDFKLMDVGRVLPLNRSYLSRVFNEGFNQNFSDVIRIYRINHAKEILLEHPNMTLFNVAERCGFASDSTFIRAFQKVTGVTPKRFREQIGEERNGLR